jgi:hypothetical protein
VSNIWYEADGGRWQSVFVAEGTPLEGDGLGAANVRFVRFGRGADRGVCLLARPEVRVLVNGHPVAGGFRLLEHRDEVLAGGKRFFYSSETTPVIALFHAEAGARPCTCPVCRGVIKEGDTAVQCPGCGRWFHQLEPVEGKPPRRCWTYSATCRICQHPTALEGEAVWRPEKEEAGV